VENTLFERLRALDLAAKDYAIFGSGPLAARGIIATCNDLDVICRGAVWQRVRSAGEIVYLHQYNVEIVTMYQETLSFGTQWGIGDFDTDVLIDSAELIRGLPFVRLEHVISYKKIRRSPKDLVHLEALARSGIAN
jgi:hypothetical protein